MNLISKLFGRKSSDEDKREKEQSKIIQTLKIDGLKALKTGQLDQAEAFYHKILELKPNDLDGLIYSSKLYIRNGQFDLALINMQKVKELLPNSIDIKINLINIYQHIGEFNKIIELSHEILTQDEANTDALYAQGVAHYSLKDLFNAIASLTRCIAIDNYHTNALYMRAKILLEMGQIDNAQEDLDNLLERDKNNEDALLLKATIFEQSENIGDAITIYKKIVELNPFNHEAYLNLAKIYVTNKQLEEALTILNESLELSLEIADTHQMRGNVKFLLGDKNGALEDLQTVLRLAPERKEAIDGQFKNL